MFVDGIDHVLLSGCFIGWWSSLVVQNILGLVKVHWTQLSIPLIAYSILYTAIHILS